MAEARRLTRLAAQVESRLDLPEGPLVVALSGGADSAALLWLCVRLKRQVRAVHVHHGLAASDMLAEAANSMARSLGVALETKRVEVGTGPSPEDQARRVRYEAFEEAIGPGEWILTGHTSDDQAETVLDRLFRSSGIDGLAGIPARRPPYARPILGVSRSETRELATLAGLSWRDDPVNESLEPRRNRIRRRLIPALEAEFNPRLRQSLAVTARLVGEDVTYLDSLLSGVVFRSVGDGVAVAASVISTAPPALGARIARGLLEAAGLRSASAEAVAGVLEVARGHIRAYEPGLGLSVRRRGAMVVVSHAEAPGFEPMQLATPGVTVVSDWRFTATVTPDPPTAMPLGAGWMVADADLVAALGADVDAETDAGIVVAPGGAIEGSAKYLAAAGVSAPDRASYPVLMAGTEMIWIPSVRRFPVGWAEATTERYLVIRSQSEQTCHRYKP